MSSTKVGETWKPFSNLIRGKPVTRSLSLFLAMKMFDSISFFTFFQKWTTWSSPDSSAVLKKDTKDFQDYFTVLKNNTRGPQEPFILKKKDTRKYLRPFQPFSKTKHRHPPKSFSNCSKNKTPEVPTIFHINGKTFSFGVALFSPKLIVFFCRSFPIDVSKKVGET